MTCADKSKLYKTTKLAWKQCVKIVAILEGKDQSITARNPAWKDDIDFDPSFCSSNSQKMSLLDDYLEPFFNRCKENGVRSPIGQTGASKQLKKQPMRQIQQHEPLRCRRIRRKIFSRVSILSIMMPMRPRIPLRLPASPTKRQSESESENHTAKRARTDEKADSIDEAIVLSDQDLHRVIATLIWHPRLRRICSAGMWLVMKVWNLSRGTMTMNRL